MYGPTRITKWRAARKQVFKNDAALMGNRSTRFGTIGFLQVNSGTVSGRLFQITDHGIEPIGG